MKAVDVIGYVLNGAAYCDDCAHNGDPIFADTEHAFSCDNCGWLFGNVEVKSAVIPDNIDLMEESLEAPSADAQQQRRVRR